jgi:hypothetical protein
LINPPFDRRNEFRSELDFVEDQRRGVGVEKEIGIAPCAAEIDDWVKEYRSPTARRGKTALNQRALPHLSSARDDDNGKVIDEPSQLRGEQARLKHAAILGLSFLDIAV